MKQFKNNNSGSHLISQSPGTPSLYLVVLIEFQNTPKKKNTNYAPANIYLFKINNFSTVDFEQVNVSWDA